MRKQIDGGRIFALMILIIWCMLMIALLAIGIYKLASGGEDGGWFLVGGIIMIIITLYSVPGRETGVVDNCCACCRCECESCEDEECCQK